MTKLNKTKKHFIIACAALAACVCTLKGEPSKRDQDKHIVEANNDLDRVYQQILAVLRSRINAGDYDAKKLKDSLVEAERAWIKWRDAEASRRAYAGGAVGGSALAEDVRENLLELIDERKDFLQEYLKSVQQ